MTSENKATPQYALVDTTAGTVRGRWRPDLGKTCAFLGIPFAQAPVGSLRFAAPRPVEPWEGVLDALDYGATPVRRDDPNSLIPEPAIPGESTLNVNVFTPSPGEAGEAGEAGGESAALPVLVWIHGGGYTGGSPASPWYDGASFNRDGVVVVSLSYRVGFIGFGWVEGAPQNRGVLDWLAGLQWVQDNIAAFGGDPARVTIAGQSAGGGAVLTLLGMESAQHLFHGVFSLSGALADVSVTDAKKLAAQVGAQLGVAPTKQALEAVPEERILAAQEKATALTSPMDAIHLIRDGLNLGPVVDGSVIQRPTLESLAAGVGADKHLLLGSADDEFTMVFTPMEKVLRWVPRRLGLRLMGLKGRDVALYLYANPRAAGSDTAYLLGHFFTDHLFHILVLRTALLRGSAPTWVYQFSYTQPDTDLAIHCLDVPFWFDCLGSERVTKLAGPNPPQSLATAMHKFAARFVETGDPGWPRWTNERGDIQVFGPGADTTVRAGGYDEVRPLLR